jgi:hypothetical protein
MANIDMNFPLFKGKTFSDILGDIYENQQSKKKNISSLIEEMRKLVTKPTDVITIGPIITQLIEASITNDDHLIKIANIAQKLVLANTKKVGDEGWLSEDDKKQLLNEIEITARSIESNTDDKIEDLEFEIESLKETLGNK